MNKILKMQDEIISQYNILTTIASMYLTVHVIDLVEDSFIEFNVSNEVAAHIDENKKASEVILDVMNNTVELAHRDAVNKFCDLHSLRERLVNKNEISESFIGIHVGWFRSKFIVLKRNENGEVISVIHTTEVIDNQKKKEERLLLQQKKQNEIIQGLAGDFISIYYIDKITGEFDLYTKDEMHRLIREEKRSKDFFKSAMHFGKSMVYPEDLDYFEEKFQISIIEKALKENNKYSFTVRMFYNGVPTYFQYRFVKPIIDMENKLIVGVYNVDAEIRKEQKKLEEIRLANEQITMLTMQTNKLHEEANIDSLTGLFNRRAYEYDMELLGAGDVLIKNGCFYVAIDMNGLKEINDTLGHEAGDEALAGAAFCLKKCLESYGKVYRIGGDEFAAILSVDKNKFEEIIEDLNQEELAWKGNLIGEISFSYGYASSFEYREITMRELGRIADKRMYQNKALYYSKNGIDRRSQKQAIDAIFKSYTKILKVNLTEDSFSIIQMDAAEKDEKKGFDDRISKWLQDFASSGQVHKDDVDRFLEMTDITYLQEYFKKENSNYSIHYKRMIEGTYRYAMMEMIPANEYTDDNQIVFLYVKRIEI